MTERRARYSVKVNRSDPEQEFQAQIHDLPPARREYMFHPTRKWRFDFAWPDLLLAVEVEGGIWTGGRHVSPVGFTKDCLKYNEAAMLGWLVLRFTPAMIQDGTARRYIEFAIERTKRGEI